MFVITGSSLMDNLLHTLSTLNQGKAALAEGCARAAGAESEGTSGRRWEEQARWDGEGHSRRRAQSSGKSSLEKHDREEVRLQSRGLWGVHRSRQGQAGTRIRVTTVSHLPGNNEVPYMQQPLRDPAKKA